MCDNLGIDDEKVTVYSFLDENTSPHSIIFEDLNSLIENFKASIEDMSNDGDEFECKVKMVTMTRHQIENLPEFNG